MSYIEESLSKDEKIHEVYKLHWVAKIPMFFWLILAIRHNRTDPAVSALGVVKT